MKPADTCQFPRNSSCRSHWITAALLLALILPGCASPESHECVLSVTGSHVLFQQQLLMNTHEKERISSTGVTVYQNKSPDAAFEEIGMVEAVAKGDNVELRHLIPELRRQAQLLWAEGIHKIEFNRFNHDGPAVAATAFAITFTKAR